jgi:hypothetical protein
MSNLTNFLFLAEANLEAVHTAFNNRKTDVMPLLSMLLIALVAGGLFYGVKCWRQRQLARTLTDPAQLFNELCRAHQLSRGDIALLKQLATMLSLPSPSILMVDSTAWKLHELLRTNKIMQKKFEQLHKLQRTLYQEPRLSIPGAI